MSPDSIVDLFNHAVLIIIMMVATLVLPGLLVGLLVSMFQAATQINEQTLSFIPRLFVTFLAFLFAGPYLLRQIIEFSNNLFESIPSLLG